MRCLGQAVNDPTVGFVEANLAVRGDVAGEDSDRLCAIEQGFFDTELDFVDFLGPSIGVPEREVLRDGENAADEASFGE